MSNLIMPPGVPGTARVAQINVVPAAEVSTQCKRAEVVMIRARAKLIETSATLNALRVQIEHSITQLQHVDLVGANANRDLFAGAPELQMLEDTLCAVHDAIVTLDNSAEDIPWDREDLAASEAEAVS